jgi:uncharacterized membrane-anchored protein YjiN (DUF445 family)
MQHRATGLLAVMAAGFVVVSVWGHGRGWSGYLQATLEASLVGGLADWFAVTALFRRPLGLPIPHTAVIPERKEQFGQTLGAFVQENFFRPDVLSERIRAAHLPQRGADWLAVEGNAEVVVRRAGDLIASLLTTSGAGDRSGWLEVELQQAIRALPVSVTAGRILEFASAHGLHREVLDRGVENLRRWLAEHRSDIRARFRHEAPWWLPDVVDDRIFGRLFDGVQRLLDDIGANPNHEFRTELDRWLTSVADQLQHSPEWQAKGEALKAEWLGRGDLVDSFRPLLSDAQAALRAQLTDPRSTLRQRLVAAMVTTAQRFRDDPVLVDKASDALESAARAVVEQFQQDIAGLVSSTVARWDGRETADKLELLLGKDLQYIRINGTVVGALAGLCIHLVARGIS